MKSLLKVCMRLKSLVLTGDEQRIDQQQKLEKMHTAVLRTLCLMLPKVQYAIFSDFYWFFIRCSSPIILNAMH